MTREARTSQDVERTFEAAWKDCEPWLDGFNAQHMPDILEMHHVETLRKMGCRIPRRPAHNILLAARGLMRAELDNCNEDVIYKSLVDRPWQALVAGVADKIRKDLVGPGIREFRLEMRRNGTWLPLHWWRSHGRIRCCERRWEGHSSSPCD